MSGIVADGDKRYVEANLVELEVTFKQQVAEIEARYALLDKGNLFVRWGRWMAMHREITRVRRSVFGMDNLYLMSKRR